VADNLQEIKGIGPVIEQDHFSQIANFSQQDIDNVNTACDFPGRIERDEWIPQARGLESKRGSSQSSHGIERDEWIPQAKRLMQGSSNSGGHQSNHSAGLAAAAAATAGGVAVATTIDPAKDSPANRKDPATLSDNALTDEIRDRIRILKLQDKDAPRLAVNRESASVNGA